VEIGCGNGVGNLSTKHQGKTAYDEWEEHTEPTNPTTQCFGVKHSEYLV
jgi:hypothetical protein